MRKFVVRRSAALTQLGASFTLDVAANYPTVPRIQDNARLDLASRGPWLDQVTAVADTAPARHGAVRGEVVDVDVDPADQRQLAVVTRDGESTALLYLFHCTGDGPSSLPDPVDVGKLADRVGLCARFVPLPGASVFENMFLTFSSSLQISKQRVLTGVFL